MKKIYTPVEMYAIKQNELMLKLADGIICKKDYVLSLTILYASLKKEEEMIINQAYADGQNDRLKNKIQENYFEINIKKKGPAIKPAPDKR